MCVMPLGEMVGNRLPMKYPLPVVLTVAGCLGILVTYAEPAIASLAPLAQLVDKQKVGGRAGGRAGGQAGGRTGRHRPATDTCSSEQIQATHQDGNQ